MPLPHGSHCICAKCEDRRARASAATPQTSKAEALGSSAGLDESERTKTVEKRWWLVECRGNLGTWFSMTNCECLETARRIAETYRNFRPRIVEVVERRTVVESLRADSSNEKKLSYRRSWRAGCAAVATWWWLAASVTAEPVSSGAVLGRVGSYEINERLNLVGNNLAAISCVIIDVFGQKMGKVMAQSSELILADKVAPQLCRVAAEVLDVGDIGGIRGLHIAVANALNIGEPTPKKATEINTPSFTLAKQGQPVSNNDGDGSGKPTSDDRPKIELHSYLIGWVLGLLFWVSFFWFCSHWHEFAHWFRVRKRPNVPDQRAAGGARE